MRHFVVVRARDRTDPTVFFPASRGSTVYEHSHSRDVSPPVPFYSGVDAWTASHFSAFNATRFEVAYAGQTVPLDTWSEVDPALDRADGMVRDYAPLAFRATSLLELAAVPAMIANGTLPSEGVPSLEDLIAAVGDHSNHDRILPATSPKDAAATMAFLTEPRDVALRVRRADAAPDAPEFEEIALGQFPLAMKRSERSNGWKACKYQRFGFYKAGTCVTYSLLDQLCVKVREPEGAEPGTLAWELDASYGGVGCDPMLHWKPDSWHRVHAPLTGADPSLSSLRLQGRRPGVASTGAVVVHHAKDPMLLARNLTGGTMFFAEEAAGRSAAATVMIVVGLATAVPGLCLVAPFARRALRGEKAFQRSGRTPRRNRGGDQDAFADVL